MAHSRDQHSLVFICRDYSSLSYCSVYFPVYRSIGQRCLNFEGRDLMVRGCGSRGNSPLRHIFFGRAVRLQHSRLLSKINPLTPAPFHSLLPDPCIYKYVLVYQHDTVLVNTNQPVKCVCELELEHCSVLWTSLFMEKRGSAI